MGTRAAFWVGDPRDIENRQWLGCKAFDGHHDNFPQFAEAKTEAEFRGMVAVLELDHDFAKAGSGWPYPWDDDVFLTDFTYAWLDDKVCATNFRHGFLPYSPDAEWPDEIDPTMQDVPAPEKYNRAQPDSIMIIRIGGIEAFNGPQLPQ